MARVGGQSPDSYGLSLSVKVPLASRDRVVEQNTPLVWMGGAYQVAVATAGEPFDLVAKHMIDDPDDPLGVWLSPGGSRIQVFKYSGETPIISGSVVADGLGGVMSAGTDATTGEPIRNNTRVLYVGFGKCEVLI